MRTGGRTARPLSRLRLKTSLVGRRLLTRLGMKPSWPGSLLVSWLGVKASLRGPGPLGLKASRRRAWLTLKLALPRSRSSRLGLGLVLLRRRGRRPWLMLLWLRRLLRVKATAGVGLGVGRRNRTDDPQRRRQALEETCVSHHSHHVSGRQELLIEWDRPSPAQGFGASRRWQAPQLNAPFSGFSGLNTGRPSSAPMGGSTSSAMNFVHFGQVGSSFSLA